MKKYKGRLVGILGTVIIHLIAAIIFMSFQLKSIRRDLRTEFTIEFIQVAESEEEDKRLIELPASSIEKILQGDEELLNIARNLANQPDIELIRKNMSIRSGGTHRKRFAQSREPY